MNALQKIITLAILAIASSASLSAGYFYDVGYNAPYSIQGYHNDSDAAVFITANVSIYLHYTIGGETGPYDFAYGNFSMWVAPGETVDNFSILASEAITNLYSPTYYYNIYCDMYITSEEYQ